MEPIFSRPSQPGQGQPSHNSIISKIIKSSLWFSVPCSGITEPLEGSLGGPVSSWRPVSSAMVQLSPHTPGLHLPLIPADVCCVSHPHSGSLPLTPLHHHYFQLLMLATSFNPAWPHGISEKTFAVLPEAALRFHNAAAVWALEHSFLLQAHHLSQRIHEGPWITSLPAPHQQVSPDTTQGSSVPRLRVRQVSVLGKQWGLRVSGLKVLRAQGDTHRPGASFHRTGVRVGDTALRARGVVRFAQQRPKFRALAFS